MTEDLELGDDELDDFQPWTDEGRSRVLATASDLAAAVHVHASAVAAADGDSAMPGVFAAGDELVTAVLAYVDAQFDYTGSAYPLGIVGNLVDDDDDEDDEDDAPPRPTSGVTVLRRTDYGVEDEAAILEAGRAAYKVVWPEDSDDAAVADVSDLGRAFYQIAHAHGWAALADTPGLRPTGSVAVVQQQDELLGPDPDEWPEALFQSQGDQLYELRDVYP